MHIEDLITSLILTNSTRLSEWETTIVYSLSSQLNNDTGFTEKQATLALRILIKHQQILSASLKQDIRQYLENPRYRYPFRTISTVKKISIEQHEVYGRAIRVEFPFNESTVNLIRGSRKNSVEPTWDKDRKSWIFPLTEDSIHFLSELTNLERFDYDEEFQLYLDQFNAIIDNIDQHIPMLILENGKPKFKNISKFMPELSTDDILSAMFEARRYGIVTWDDEINDWFNNSDLSELTKLFLTVEPSEKIEYNCNLHPIECISDIVKYMSPCLFVIPGGSEFTKLKLSYDFLKTMNIENADMSVMFRLASENDKKFNEFVKENQLNSPIGKNTKIVFISGKLPKPVLAAERHSDIKFNSVINLGFSSVHYSVTQYLENQENKIYYSEIKAKKESQFAIM